MPRANRYMVSGQIFMQSLQGDFALGSVQNLSHILGRVVG